MVLWGWCEARPTGCPGCLSKCRSTAFLTGPLSKKICGDVSSWDSWPGRNCAESPSDGPPTHSYLAGQSLNIAPLHALQRLLLSLARGFNQSPLRSIRTQELRQTLAHHGPAGVQTVVALSFGAITRSPWLWTTLRGTKNCEHDKERRPPLTHPGRSSRYAVVDCPV